MTEAGRGRLWRRFCLILSIMAVAWAALLLRGAIPELQANLPKLRLAWLLLPLAGAMIANYLGFEAFRMLVLRFKNDAYGRLPLAHLYFIAQLMKHLPGRIWGVAYQSTAGSSIGVAGWMSVTIANTALATWFAIWMAAGVMGFDAHPTLGGCVVASGFVVYWFGWSGWLLVPSLRLLQRIPGKVFTKLGSELMPFASCPPLFKLRVLGVFMVFWGIYLGSWIGYGMAWPSLMPEDGMLLCALYTLAWLVGFFAFVTPSGMGVRELAFALLAHRYPADVVAGTAVLARVMLLVADIALGAVFGWFSPKRMGNE